MSKDSLVQIGESKNGNLLILCTSNNVFYGYTDDCLNKEKILMKC